MCLITEQVTNAGAVADQAEPKPSNLLRVPTLVLATAQKPKAPSAISPALPALSKPAGIPNGGPPQAQPQNAMLAQTPLEAALQVAAPSGSSQKGAVFVLRI